MLQGPTLVALGLGAGALTTFAGAGGGLVVSLLLFMVMPPVEALAITAPALLVANLHRYWLYRRYVDRGIALRYVLGAVPAAALGGWVAVSMPPWSVKVIALLLALAAAARVLLGIRWVLPRNAILPGGAAVGLLTATTGGGGLLHGPMLLSAGLSGPAYLATGSIGASCVHLGRIGGYGAGGVATDLLASSLIGVGMVTGNLLGRRGRAFVPPHWMPHLEVGAVLFMVTIAILGLT